MNSDSRDTDFDDDIPILSDVVDLPPEEPTSPLDQNRLAELHAELATRTQDLADELIHTAFQQFEATIFEHVSNRLRTDLPELIENILKDYLSPRS